MTTGKRAAYNERLMAALAADPAHAMHGRSVSYRAGCRCRACRLAQVARVRDYDARLLAALQADPDHRLHGTSTAHHAGCRCPPCSRADSARQSAGRERRKG